MDIFDFLTYPWRWFSGGIWYKVFRRSPPWGEYIWRRIECGQDIVCDRHEDLLKIEDHC